MSNIGDSAWLVRRTGAGNGSWPVFCGEVKSKGQISSPMKYENAGPAQRASVGLKVGQVDGFTCFGGVFFQTKYRPQLAAQLMLTCCSHLPNQAYALHLVTALDVQ